MMYGKDLLGVLDSHFLDVDATHGRHHNAGPASGAVENDRKVELLLKRDALVHEHFGHELTIGPGLFGHQRVAKHLGRHLADLGER